MVLRSLKGIIGTLEARSSGLTEPDVYRCLIRVDGYSCAGRGATIDGKLFSRILVDLERELKGLSTTLSFQNLTVVGPLILNGLVFERTLRLIRCRFLGAVEAREMACRSLVLDRSLFVSSFDGRVMSLRGNLFLRGSRMMRSTLIRDSSIDGVIDCQSARFGVSPPARFRQVPGMNEAEHMDTAFGASRVYAKALVWRDVLVKSGRVVLLDAQIPCIRDDLRENHLRSWPEKSKLSIRGFRYGTKSHAELATHIEWLDLDPENFEGNARVLVSALENANDLDDAAKLQLEIRRRASRRIGGLRGWARGLYVGVQRFAFYPSVALSMLMGLYLATTLTSGFLYDHKLIGPTGTGLLSDVCFSQRSAACLTKGWEWVLGQDFALPRSLPRFDKYEFALGLLFPYGPAGRSDAWGGEGLIVSLGLLVLRAVALMLQVTLAWSLFGNKDVR